MMSIHMYTHVDFINLRVVDFLRVGYIILYQDFMNNISNCPHAHVTKLLLVYITTSMAYIVTTVASTGPSCTA